MRCPILLVIVAMATLFAPAQTPAEDYEAFRRSAQQSYDDFRGECNREYAEFLKTAWQYFETRPAVPSHDKYKKVPPVVYEDDSAESVPVEVRPREVPVLDNSPQPHPLGPVLEHDVPVYAFNFTFYGLDCTVRMPPEARLKSNIVTPEKLSHDWASLCTPGMDNALRDCLAARFRYRLCDWAYLQFLDELCTKFCGDADAATLVTAYLYCQSGYQMRLGIDAGNHLVLLYGSLHSVFDTPYFYADGLNLYPYGHFKGPLKICPIRFKGEKPLSLIISQEQDLGGGMSESRQIKSKRYRDVVAISAVPQQTISFFNSYPASAVDHNLMTKWAVYAEAPFTAAVAEKLYSDLRLRLEGLTLLESAERLLNWVQTGFVYEYDDKVWGHDRAFFAEETLYYPYADCEDRAILFSRLIRDLLDLDVALIYYPGHLATAVCFDEEVRGSSMNIGGRKFIVCDPTYIGAPVGAQMPNLEYDKAEAIVLNR